MICYVICGAFCMLCNSGVSGVRVQIMIFSTDDDHGWLWWSNNESDNQCPRLSPKVATFMHPWPKHCTGAFFQKYKVWQTVGAVPFALEGAFEGTTTAPLFGDVINSFRSIPKFDVPLVHVGLKFKVSYQWHDIKYSRYILFINIIYFLIWIIFDIYNIYYIIIITII